MAVVSAVWNYCGGGAAAVADGGDGGLGAGGVDVNESHVEAIDVVAVFELCEHFVFGMVLPALVVHIGRGRYCHGYC